MCWRGYRRPNAEYQIGDFILSAENGGRRRRASSAHVRIIGAGRIAICSGASTEVIEWNDVVLARSAKNHTWIATRHGAVRVRRPLRMIICALAELGLIQIHRRVAVNDSKVRRLVRSGRRRLDIQLDDDLLLEVGRQYQRIIRARFGAEWRVRPVSEPRSEDGDSREAVFQHV